MEVRKKKVVRFCELQILILILILNYNLLDRRVFCVRFEEDRPVTARGITQRGDVP